MSNNKYKVGDEVVFLTDTYNKGIRFTITKTFSQMLSTLNPGLDIYSYELNSGITTLRKPEEDLYWIPSGTIDRPKDK